eukprot:790192-Prorocentrum_minimum.AAC.3
MGCELTVGFLRKAVRSHGPCEMIRSMILLANNRVPNVDRRGQGVEKQPESDSKPAEEEEEENKPMGWGEKIATNILMPLFLLVNIYTAGHKLYTYYEEFVTVPIHQPDDFVGMRKAGRGVHPPFPFREISRFDGFSVGRAYCLIVANSLVAAAFDHVEPLFVPGVSTWAMDQEVATFAVINNATSAALGYKGFPNTCCISVNDVVLQ